RRFWSRATWCVSSQARSARGKSTKPIAGKWPRRSGSNCSRTIRSSAAAAIAFRPWTCRPRVACPPGCTPRPCSRARLASNAIAASCIPCPRTLSSFGTRRWYSPIVRQRIPGNGGREASRRLADSVCRARPISRDVLHLGVGESEFLLVLGFSGHHVLDFSLDLRSALAFPIAGLVTFTADGLNFRFAGIDIRGGGYRAHRKKDTGDDHSI